MLINNNSLETLDHTKPSCCSEHSAHLVGANDEYDVVKISRATNVLSDLVQPNVEGIKTGSIGYIKHQQSTLSVGIELISYLTHQQSPLHTTSICTLVSIVKLQIPNYN